MSNFFVTHLIRTMDPVCQSRRESETAAQEHTETQGKLYPFETQWTESKWLRLMMIARFEEFSI